MTSGSYIAKVAGEDTGHGGISRGWYPHQPQMELKISFLDSFQDLFNIFCKFYAINIFY